VKLFIDTNVFLSFFQFSADDLEELRKLTVSVRNGHLTLMLPDQVRAEFKRNRDGAVANALKNVRDQKISFPFPQLCREHTEFGPLMEALKKAEAARSALITAVETDSTTNSLKADVVIAELLGRGFRIAETEAHLNRAKDRMLRGNPPGKKASHGDALIWEALLEAVPDGEDLHFVSGDSDWVSPLAEEQFDSFLADEWRTRKGSEIRFFRRLSAFFRAHLPEINLVTEEEKEKLIRDLARSSSFSRSRAALRQLAAYVDFTALQLNNMARAVISNNQIYWIITDEDIAQHLRSIFGPRVNDMDPDLVVAVEQKLGGELDQSV
jgi:hypothetical protein